VDRRARDIRPQGGKRIESGRQSGSPRRGIVVGKRAIGEVILESSHEGMAAGDCTFGFLMCRRRPSGGREYLGDKVGVEQLGNVRDGDDLRRIILRNAGHGSVGGLKGVGATEGWHGDGG